jgi:hypothetical protein
MAGAQASGMKIARRILWNIYAWPITLLLVAGSFLPGQNLNGNHIILAFVVLDWLISLPSLAAMHLHIWDKKLLNPSLWKIYTFVFYAWDLIYNLLIQPTITGEKFNKFSLIGLVTLIPLYVAVFRYAFRKWNEESN